MSSVDEAAPALARQQERQQLRDQWRTLIRAATFVALLTSPAAFAWFHVQQGWSFWWSLLATAGVVIAFRGLVDVTLRKFIPWPSLFGVDDTRLREEDVVGRRRAWFWARFFRLAAWIIGLITFIYLWRVVIKNKSTTWSDTAQSIFHGIGYVFSTPQLWIQVVFVVFLFGANFLLFMGPMMLMGISQIRGFEPGDANWGVKLEDVRGQVEAKEEVRKIVTLWQSGEQFVQAGGKRERGILFNGAPGTGKTMLAKAIATGFNSPIVTIPGSGFAQTFIGIDALIVRFLARKAKKLARKWGGQCIVFIDEIDAVGLRRAALGGAQATTFAGPARFEDFCFFGPQGSLTPSGDLVLETRAWRERMFELRSPQSIPRAPGRMAAIVDQAFPGMFGGGMGQLALNQLLVTMDGIDSPPFWRRFWTNRINSLLDAVYIVPRRARGASLRLPQARPADTQIYFIGATNVPLEMLDPALTRPGRMGRHVWFRTPTKKDREDIFDLYLGKVDHDPELDTAEARDELARITNGYSPAMIDQVCSMALTSAQHDFREYFSRPDILEAMTTVESGTAVGVDYIPEETRAVAIHEAGHAAAAHVFMEGAESTRLSIKMRAGSLGHHQALEREERFSSWQHEEMARMAWTLGALAAEHVFYGENATGVGGDIQSATTRAGYMVGMCGMGPNHIELNGGFENDGDREEARKKIAERFERIGLQIMNRTAGGSAMHHDPIGSVLSDPSKRRFAAQILGQSYVNSYNLVRHNKDAVEKIADTLVDRKEIYGDELVALLDAAKLERPTIDLSEEETWPTL
jgi:ATP-dependent Zn protease